MKKVFLITVCITLMCSGVFAQNSDPEFRPDYDPERDPGSWEGDAQPQKSPYTGALPSKKEKEDDSNFEGGLSSEDTLPEDQEGKSTSSLWGFSGPDEKDTKIDEKD